ncbi:hypothetical protein DFH09DRAFT_1171026 [Mycena vulgaris]|nr:hypothetical protein DFH09DRAFT_1171026 [Mycena vulgaris]
MSSFIPTFPVNMENERDWAANLGMLDWDGTSIIFTKRSLMEFLKYTGTTVDTNFANIQKLPRYVKFGKIADSAIDSPAAATVASGSAAPSPSSDFKPTRRVRELPGGPRNNIFADEDVPDALSLAPLKVESAATVVSSSPAVGSGSAATSSTEFKPTRRVRELPGGPRTDIFADEDVPVASPKAESTAPATPSPTVEAAAAAEAKTQSNVSSGTGIKPSRRVREAPGGNSTLGSFWGSDEPEEFKPTRRVRQAPGGGTTSIF